MDSTTLVITDLSHTFSISGYHQHILQSVCLNVARQQLVMLRGPSGCGKTTLLTLISGMRTIQRGSIKVLGQELYQSHRASRNRIRASIGLIFQSHRLINFLSAEENVILAMDADVHGFSDLGLKRSRAQMLLDQLALHNHYSAMPSQLSGGQRQRVAIARALSCDAKFIIADEPTASLDFTNAIHVMEILRSLVDQQGISILMTTHDERLHVFADRILQIDNHRLVEI
jgi:putative ABC transport system ATP-binding protein